MATYYLIVPAAGKPRITSRWPSKLNEFEIAYRVNIKRPEGWGKISKGSIDITIPEDAVTQVDVGTEPL